MTITTWKATQFSKRKNSTKVPGTSPTPTSHTVRLKNPTSLVNPTIIFDGHITPSDIVYARIDDFGRYYFVADYRYDGPNTEIDFVSDPMGSFKTDIGSVDGHIVRASNSSAYDLSYTDPLNPPSQDVTFYHGSQSLQLFNEDIFDANAASYILTVMSDTGSGGNGFAVSYKVTDAQLRALADKFVDPNFIDQLYQEFTNPMDAIISCKRVPIKSTSSIWSGTTVNDIKIASYSTGIGGLQIGTHMYPLGRSITNPAASVTKYMKAPPYATYFAYLPFVGVVPVDYQNILGGAFIFDVFIDTITGDIIYKLQDNDNKPVATFSGNFATEVPVSSKSFSATGIVGGLVTVAGGAVAAGVALATGGAGLLPGLAATAAGWGAAAMSCEQHSQINGGVSSALSCKLDLDVVFFAVIKKAQSALLHVDTEGAMSHKHAQPIFYSGYLQYFNARLLGGAMTDGERTEIENYMNTGFYYE